MAGDTLTIETGLRCNNRCVFCNQPPIRQASEVLEEPTTAELMHRITAARERGFQSIAFSGGEPTLRPDLADLIAHARSAGFRRISLTSNGRMLAYPAFLDRLLDAGLTGVSLSLLGPTAEVHDALTDAPGGFVQVVRALRHLGARVVAGTPLDVSTITVLMPQNIGLLRDTLILAGSLGVSLHIVQPYIAAAENLAAADRYLLPLDDLVRGIERAMDGGLPHGGRIKPFNLPACRLDALGDRMETSSYATRTFREFAGDLDVRLGFVTSGQFYRVARCEACDRACPGIHVEHFPPDEAVRLILDAARAARASNPEGRVTVSSLDLLPAARLRQALLELRDTGTGRTRVFWGGVARAGSDAFFDACSDARIDEVCLLLRPPARRVSGQSTWLPGNLDLLEADLARFRRGSVPRPSLFVVGNTLASDDAPLDPERLRSLCATAAERGATVLYVAAPERLNDPYPPADAAQRERVLSALDDLRRALGPLGMRMRLVRTLGGTAPGSLEAAAAGALTAESWDDEMAQHPFGGLGAGWVMWSNPIWLHAPREAAIPASPPDPGPA
jgi:MoaA/NifB/PqqE/SkfB family radical SAM enzyme